ncbi:MAG: polysaccharide pyruvyl transferase CsaB [Clostridiales bacterium]|nr:polysaccharide pyruvyl transferase CsaB [Clostridiales bacterium]
MKVITLISGGDTGGAKTHVHTLLQGLNKHIQADMVCFTDGPFAQEARELGIRVDVIAGGNPLAALKALREKITQEGYDIIHCHGSRGNLMGALLMGPTGLPVVTTVHSDPKIDYMGRPLSALTFGTLNNWALRRIPYHIGVSDPMVELLIKRGYDPQQVFDIKNGLDFSNPTSPLTRREYLDSLGLDWPDDAVIVGIAARLNPVKDMGTLLRGFAAARKEQPQLRLIIAGDGEEGSMLKKLARELGVEDTVCFAGWVSDTASFYHAIDINTLTSLSEGFPYSLPEGARFALPTVATQVGGVPSLIQHDVTGLLFQPRDHEALGRHLAALAADPALRRRLGDKLLERGRANYSIENTVQTQLDIYASILRREARKGRGRDGVVVCGAYGRGNAGDEAILKAVVAELRSIDPDMPLWVMTRKPKQAKLRYRVGAGYTFNPFTFRRHIRKSVLYLNGGGSLIQDVTSHRSLWFYLFTLSSARRSGCKVLMYGCGIGPIIHPGNRRRTARVIDRCVDVITLRDSASREELRALGVTRPQVILAADPAVTLPAAPPADADALLEGMGLHPREGEKYLGVTVRPWPGFEDKVPSFAAAVDHAYERYGLIPVFIPIEGRPDAAAAQKVAAQLKKAPAHLLPACPTTELAIALYARMDAALSMRLHALIFAAVGGVPLVGVVYDPKVSAFLDDAGQDLYSRLEELTPELLCSLVDAAAARRQDRSALDEKTVRLIRLEQANREAAAKLLADPNEAGGNP